MSQEMFPLFLDFSSFLIKGKTHNAMNKHQDKQYRNINTSFSKLEEVSSRIFKYLSARSAGFRVLSKTMDQGEDVKNQKLK